MTGAVETFQVPLEVAEVYESRFVPVLFGPWAERLVEVAGIAPGSRVLDVACGTGAVARAAAGRTGRAGDVVGIDLNEAMLTVARRSQPEIEWRQGDAADLPVPSGSFDVVLCQAALMFFPDPVAALREMARVVAREGTIGVQVWDRRRGQPGYDPFIEVAERYAGEDAVGLLNAYFASGDIPQLVSAFDDAGLDVSSIRTETTIVPFGSVEELVAVELQSTPLGGMLGEDVIARIVEDARAALAPYITGNGLDMPIGGHLILARPH